MSECPFCYCKAGSEIVEPNESSRTCIANALLKKPPSRALLGLRVNDTLKTRRSIIARELLPIKRGCQAPQSLCSHVWYIADSDILEWPDNLLSCDWTYRQIVSVETSGTKLFTWSNTGHQGTAGELAKRHCIVRKGHLCLDAFGRELEIVEQRLLLHSFLLSWTRTCSEALGAKQSRARQIIIQAQTSLSNTGMACPPLVTSVGTLCPRGSIHLNLVRPLMTYTPGLAIQNAARTSYRNFRRVRQDRHRSTTHVCPRACVLWGHSAARPPEDYCEYLVVAERIVQGSDPRRVPFRHPRSSSGLQKSDLARGCLIQDPFRDMFFGRAETCAGGQHRFPSSVRVQHRHSSEVDATPKKCFGRTSCGTYHMRRKFRDEVCCHASRIILLRVLFAWHRALSRLERRNGSLRALEMDIVLAPRNTGPTRGLTTLSIAPMLGVTTHGSLPTTKAPPVRWKRKALG